MTQGSQRRAMILSMMAAGFVAGGALAWTDVRFADRIPPLTIAVVATVMLLAACAATILIWARLAEVVREAHKSAWYWGGSAGMCLALGIMVFAWRDRAGALAAALPHLTVSTGIALGIALCLALQTAGYALGWVVWWLTKR